MFYNAVKGETEDAVAALGFESVYALRPSLIDGEREERRVMERASLAVARTLGPLLGEYPADAGGGHRGGDGRRCAAPGAGAARRRGRRRWLRVAR